MRVSQKIRTEVYKLKKKMIQFKGYEVEKI